MIEMDIAPDKASPMSGHFPFWALWGENSGFHVRSLRLPDSLETGLSDVIGVKNKKRDWHIVSTFRDLSADHISDWVQANHLGLKIVWQTAI